MMNVLKPGTAVRIGPEGDKVAGTIHQVCLRGPALAVSYEVIHWHAGERKTTWLNDREIERRDEAETMQIGFAR